MTHLLLATSNPGKIKELQALLAPKICISQTELGIPDAEETGLSFVENALLKARHASRMGKMPALADDSGLVVPALQGEPGIYSARYAGPHATQEANMTLLLERMAHFSLSERQAYFYCAIVFINHANDPTPFIATGKLYGEIALKIAGSHGFGYDPIFYLPDYGCTAAELPTEVKNRISHRALALKNLLLEPNQ